MNNRYVSNGLSVDRGDAEDPTTANCAQAPILARDRWEVRTVLPKTLERRGAPDKSGGGGGGRRRRLLIDQDGNFTIIECYTIKIDLSWDPHEL